MLYKSFRRLTLFLILFVFGFLLNSKVYAHPAGSLVYLKINNVLTPQYPVPNPEISFGEFQIPYDIAAEVYIPNQELTFNVQAFSMPINVTEISQYITWDFGDGTKIKGGLNHKHTYKQARVYTVKLEIDPSILTIKDPTPTDLILKSALINITPTKNYKIPSAAIKMNGKKIDYPLTYTYDLDLEKEVTLEAIDVVHGSSKIIDYKWLISSNQIVNGTSLTAKLDNTVQKSYPILRVIDEKGYYSDTFVSIINKTFIPPETTDNSPDQTQKGSIKIIRDLEDKISKIFNQDTINYPLVLAVFLFAFIAGALHALTPGHGKSLMAVFLAGKGDSKVQDVFIIAAALTFTHTIIIYVLGFILLIVNTQLSVKELMPYFSKFSAILVLLLGFNLLQRGYKNYKHQKAHEHHHDHDDHEHGHSHEIPKIHKHHGKLELFFAGISGGITPCVDALALLLLSASFNQIVFGLLIVFVFSLGLASCVILIGILLLFGKSKLKFAEKLGPVAEVYSPLVAGSIILVISLRLLLVP